MSSSMLSHCKEIRALFFFFFLKVCSDLRCPGSILVGQRDGIEESI